MGVFQSAAVELKRRDERERDVMKGIREEKSNVEAERTYTRLSLDDWIAAVVQGANRKAAGAERGAAWREALVLGGLLLAFRSTDGEVLCRRSRKLIVGVLVEKVNAAAQEVAGPDDLGGHALSLLLNYTFGLLEEREKAAFDWDVSTVSDKNDELC